MRARGVINSFGGRRFILTVGCGLVTSLLCATGHITGKVYEIVIIATVGAYITGNTTQKAIARNKQEADA